MKCVNNCRCGKHHKHNRFPTVPLPPRRSVIPCDDFDWDAAILRLKRIFVEVYGEAYAA